MRFTFPLVFISVFLFTILSGCKDEPAAPDPFMPVKDFDGNIYTVVKIGEQYWMRENLNVTRYSDGVELPSKPGAWFPNSQYLGAYDNYNSDSTLGATYGKLYNWYAITHRRGICPKGWRVPTDDDWEELINFLGGYNVAGGKLKDTSSLWEEPNISANNIIGFSALPGGYRRFGTPSYFRMNQEAYFWSASEINWEASYFKLAYKTAAIEKLGANEHKGIGRSCRCIKETE